MPEKIRIITDSGADLPQNFHPRLTVLPMTVTFGDTAYRDGIDLSTREFYEKLIESDTLPSTSLISPASFEEACRVAVEQGEKVIIITISGNMSGTCQSAMLAAAEFPGDVFVVDSKNVATAEQILVLYTLELAEQGLTAAEITEILTNAREEIHILALLDTLEYLKKGGRISKTVAFVGGALAFKPVVTVQDGKVAMLGTARGSKNGSNYLIREIENTGGVDFSRPVGLGYTGLTDTMLEKYKQDSKSIWEGQEEMLHTSHIGATIGTHVGPGAIAVAFFGKQK